MSEPYDFKLVKPCIESKVFGIGVEAYTVGSAEFALSYAAFNREKCIPLMDNGHYHPTEVVSDKIPALLAFFPEIALHITRPIRWDSDHVVLFDDETKEICKEIVRCGGLDGRVNIALDYFDASINRISAWTVGFRNVEKALLSALCTPHTVLKELQDTNQFTELMVRQEELKTLPFGEVWDEYCRRSGVSVPGGADIAMATSELMKHYQAAIWAQHGLFASGPDFDITFGLAHTIEKSAEIYVKVLSMGGGIIRQTITDDDLRAIARDFGVTLNEKFLN